MAIKDNIKIVRERVERAAERAHRDIDEITIVAVTKTVNPKKINEAILAGVKVIGENRVQEAKQKFPAIGDKVSWHMVGHLQTNKVKDALKIFSLIQSLDSIRLAQEIERRAENPIDCLVEVNTSKESTKFGVLPGEAFKFFGDLKQFKKINILGLMTTGPGWAIQDPEASRPCFHVLHDLKDELAQEFDIQLSILSMGMTSDFEVAIEEGANMIRVGTAIFGPRNV
jgi:pyridoxal phosphate enzyme (YggS family)